MTVVIVVTIVSVLTVLTVVIVVTVVKVVTVATVVSDDKTCNKKTFVMTKRRRRKNHKKFC